VTTPVTPVSVPVPVPSTPGSVTAFLYQGPGSPRNTAIDFIITDQTAQPHFLVIFWGDSNTPDIIFLGINSGTFNFHATHKYSKQSFKAHQHKPYTIVAFVASGFPPNLTLLGTSALVFQYSPQETSSFANV
jgi:hypothetical protein